jgi:signal transduction histidine kinase/ligand-binding sensor domain-containing protein
LFTSFGAPSRIACTLVAACALLPSLCAAQVPGTMRAFGRYHQMVWRDVDGLPQNTVSAVARTPDGYLWLGTYQGLARFDGVRFTVFDSSTVPALASGLIIALIVDAAGDLWIGTDGDGLVHYSRGRFIQYSLSHGLSNPHVMSLATGRAGELWVGTDGGGLNHFANGRFTAVTTRDGLPGDRVWALAQPADDGVLWVGTNGGLAAYDGRRFIDYRQTMSGEVRSLSRDLNGGLWIGFASAGVARFAGGQFVRYGRREGLVDDSVNVLYHDRDGTLWVGTNGGVARFHEGRFTVYSSAQGLPGDEVVCIYRDPDGDVWVGTNGTGLARLREPRIRTFTAEDGFSNGSVGTILGDGSGLWVANSGVLSHFDGRRFVTYTARDGLPAGVGRTMARDASGELWLGTSAGLHKWKPGTAQTWTTADGMSSDEVWSLLLDRSGAVWIGTVNGLNRFQNGRFTTYSARDGLAGNFVLALHEDRRGRLWIGTRSGGLSRFADGAFRTWTKADGLGVNHVLSFHEDADGVIWAGTHGGGLARIENDRATTISSRSGLYDDVAFRIVEDDAGDFWMSGNRGIYRASRRELNAFAAGQVASVSSFAYGVGDGMVSRECNWGHPGGWRTADGRLWFPTVHGLVAVDPRTRNTAPPLLSIETISVDRQPHPFAEPVQLAPGARDLEIAYTALSWARPQHVRFRYMLEGLDETWTEAGSRRTAYYSRVPPGHYVFKVTADNGDGVWSPEARTLAVTVLPAWYQTRAFATTVPVAVIGALVLAWRTRVRQLQRARAAQQAFSTRLIASQEGERQRIAAELHDSLGQLLLIIKNRVELAGRDAAVPRPVGEQLADIGTSAAQALAEVRAIAHNLRPPNFDRLGLTMAIEEMAENVADAAAIECVVDLEPMDGLFLADDQILVYRILQESLNNIVKHSGATRAAIELWRENDVVYLTVRDNGHGFDAARRDSPTSTRGLGLTSIAERVRMLGGTHAVSSSLGKGTELTVQLPVRSGSVHPYGG